MDVPTQAPDIVFNGMDGNECEVFVAAIRNHAFENERDEDHQWMLRFATARLRRKALRWHARLDPSIKKDWDLFVQALFDQYPSVGEPGEAEIATQCGPQPTSVPALRRLRSRKPPKIKHMALGFNLSVKGLTLQVVSVETHQ